MTTLNISDLHLDIDNARSYKTEAGLHRAVDKLTRGKEPTSKGVLYLTVCNREGRYTAIFNVNWLTGTPLEGDMITIPYYGFILMG